MTHTINEVPESIWVELIISDNGFEIKVPNGKRTPLIAQAYEWTKDQNPFRIRDVKPSVEENSKKFQAILDDLNRNGSSKEHNYWRRVVIQHRNGK